MILCLTAGKLQVFKNREDDVGMAKKTKKEKEEEEKNFGIFVCSSEGMMAERKKERAIHKSFIKFSAGVLSSIHKLHEIDVTALFSSFFFFTNKLN